MPVMRLNHAVLYVRDLHASVEFYRNVMGFEAVLQARGAAFLQASGSDNDHDLGLFELGPAAVDSPAGQSAVGLYHLAWEVDTLDELAQTTQRLTEAGALVGATDHATTKAVYAKDPDGLEFEVCWLVPADRITEEILAAKKTMKPLDLEAAMAEFGSTTRGGVGISV